MTRQGFEITQEDIQRGEKIFRGECRFVAGAQTLSAIPKSNVPEVAFAGRSNVGKSSLINALTNRKSLARASNTPGRTQQINFFSLQDQLQLADMPGYGYAKTSRSKSHAWNSMVSGYLNSRNNLKRICVLIDSRHGILEADEKALAIFDEARVPYIGVLTKADKIKPSELAAVTESVEAYFAKCKSAFPAVHATSSEKGIGIAELRAILAVF